MSYAIRYGQDTKQERSMKRLRNRKRMGWILVVAAMLTAVLWPHGQTLIRQLLFPCLEAGTVEAFGLMLEQIGDGAAIPVALADFCRTVIANGAVPV